MVQASGERLDVADRLAQTLSPALPRAVAGVTGTSAQGCPYPIDAPQKNNNPVN
jgi:hypothetical protein